MNDRGLRASDPLWRQARARSGPFLANPPGAYLLLVIGVLTLSAAFSGPPAFRLGFESEEESPPTVRSSTTTTTTSTTVATATSTTEAPVDAAEVRAALAGAGFPNIEVIVRGRTVRLDGQVPDDSARAAMIERVRAVERVEEVLDLTTTAGAAGTAVADVVVSRAEVTISGVVTDEATRSALVGILDARFPRVDAGLLAVEPGLTATVVVVEGTAPSSELAAALSDDLSRLDASIAVQLEQSTPARWETEADALLADVVVFDGVGLTPAGDAVMPSLATILAATSVTDVEVGVHGGGADAREVSVARAEAFATALERALVAAGARVTIDPVGYGEQRNWPGLPVERVELRGG